MIKPSGPLMVEHRLIEKMVNLLKKEIIRIKKDGYLNSKFIDSAVDFFRIYADKTHHGKEEDILFKAMAKKPMSSDMKNMMDELIKDHITARLQVSALAECKNNDKAIEIMQSLIALYPPHIQKEDIMFFPKSMKLLSEEEQDAMTKEFYEFDRKMIHTKYKSVVEALSK
jgi:hemerythrin-like domain-containing protein